MKPHRVGTTEPGLELQRLKVEELLNRLDREMRDVSECRVYLEVVDQNLRRSRWSYSKYDFAVDALHQIRHRLCDIVPTATDLLDIECDIRGDVPYIQDHQRQVECEKNLEYTNRHIVQEIGRRSEKDVDRHHPCRARLRMASESAGNAREAQWRRTNRQRTRLLWTSILLLIALAMSVLLVYFYSVIVRKSGADFSASGLGAALALGAMGALVSSLLSEEPRGLGAAEYEIRQLLQWLKPLVGAAMALVMYLLYWAVLYSVFPKNNFVPLVLAFAAGFSERIVVAQIETLAGRISSPTSENIPSSEGDGHRQPS